LAAAGKARQRIQEYIWDLFDNDNKTGRRNDIPKLEEEVFSELANDLHTPKALASIFSFINAYPVSSLSRISCKKLLRFFKKLNRIFEVWQIEQRPETTLKIPEYVINLAEDRLKARSEKNWAESDRLRELIKAAGYIIKDGKESYLIEKI